MLDALRFVATAVAKKDYVAELTHFKIRNGRVTAFNGTLALSSPIDVDLDVQPQAARMIAAVRACTGTIALHVTPAGKLAVKSGKFRSFVECIAEDIEQFVSPEGEEVSFGPNFMPGVKALAPLMGVDASRPWAMGIKLSQQSMYATNNVMLAQYWHGYEMPLDVIIPAPCINELLRVDQEPSRIQVSQNSITFHFSDGRWIRSGLLIDGGWPTGRVDELMAGAGDDLQPFPPGLFEAVDTLKNFLNDRGSLYVTASSISTEPDGDTGTAVEIELPQIAEMQAYHHRQLVLLGLVATSMDWTKYPRPCQFRGADGKLRGVIIGQKV